MTNHPGFQPTLTRGNVAMLLRFITNERDDVMAQPGSADTPANAAYMLGLEFAENAILTMWASAVIAADALTQDFTRDMEELEEKARAGGVVSNLESAILHVEDAYHCLDENDTGRFELGKIRARLERARSEAERA